MKEGATRGDVVFVVLVLVGFGLLIAMVRGVERL